jgi:hypothetical protein
MNYGDGLYAGQFVSCMYAEAFFETDVLKLIEAGLRCIPPKSQYAEAINDVLTWWQENPDDWEVTWQRIQAKYHDNPDYRRHSCEDEYFTGSDFNIDAKIKGAYVVLGLLYGEGDPQRQMKPVVPTGSQCAPGRTPTATPRPPAVCSSQRLASTRFRGSTPTT